ncbi:hypothetical protein EV385_0263 [Krasilnikovia cinnamomea]|uniref:Uncharacterized protein n=1 Tax=Krasilnikovia cinnamomea TaxID=349313 RepID=A0A4V6MG21_9ACTN|nr:hypothetical protein [Krasilnikovia cinnamomea]RZU48546.1 hypothetical protein EV385_0263 [Krasilnikovia cinnamomea]
MRPGLAFRAATAVYVAAVAVLAAAGSGVAAPLVFPTGLLYVPADRWLTGPGTAPPLARIAVLCVFAVANAHLVRAMLRLLPADPAERAVARRLARALVGSGVPVTAAAGGAGRIRTPGGQLRRQRSLDLRDLPVSYPELVAVYRGMWRRAGLTVQQRPDPPGLRARDPQGYEYVMEPGPAGAAVLRVSGPVRRFRGLARAALAVSVPALGVALWLVLPRMF